jgi:hypothetical protein
MLSRACVTIGIAWLLVAQIGCASVPASVPLLDSLAAELRSLRTLPVGASSNARCPSDTARLVGLRKSQIRDALGEPDYIDRAGITWTYFFSSPIPAGQLGGGHPELSFVFETSDQVASVTCHYSR